MKNDKQSVANVVGHSQWTKERAIDCRSVDKEPFSSAKCKQTGRKTNEISQARHYVQPAILTRWELMRYHVEFYKSFIGIEIWQYASVHRIMLNKNSSNISGSLLFC